MDSDDEFEVPRSLGSQIVDGLKLRELVETGSTSFQIREDRYDTSGRSAQRNLEEELLKEEELAMLSMEKQYYSGYDKTQLFIEKDVDIDNQTFEQLSKAMDNVIEDGRIKKLIVEPGFGKQISEGQIVYIHYQVCMEGGDETVVEKFFLDDSKDHESSRGRVGQPTRIKAGAGMVLPVLDLGVLTMQSGEKAFFLSHWEFAYGKLGHPPKIPPETEILVHVEVIKVEDGSVKTNIFDMEKDERMNLPFEELHKGVLELKRYGNDAFEAAEYDRGRMEYKKALEILHDIVTPNENYNRQKIELLYTLYINIAQCHIKQEKYKRAKEYCLNAIRVPIPKTKQTKAYYRLALCSSHMGLVEEARQNIEIAKGLDAFNDEIDKLYRKVYQKINDDKGNEKKYAQKMFQKMSLN